MARGAQGAASAAPFPDRYVTDSGACFAARMTKGGKIVLGPPVDGAHPIVAVRFKHEDEGGAGNPIGPIDLLHEFEIGDVTQLASQPFDPDRDEQWFSLPQAAWLAAALGVRLEET